MKRLFPWLLLACSVPAVAQTPIAFTDSGTVKLPDGTALVWSPQGAVYGHDSYDQEVLANPLVNGGFEKWSYSVMVQVDPLQAGSTTVFASNNSFASWEANALFGYAYSDIRNSVSVCSGAQGSSTGIQGNNLGSTTAVTATRTGSVLTALNVITASQPGLANGNYNLLITGGGASVNATGHITVSGASQSGSGFTGGTITATLDTGGTGYTGTPTVEIQPMIITPTCGASGGYSVSDYVMVNYVEPFTDQAEWPYLGWAVSVSGGATVNGETSLLSNLNLPAGTQNGQAIELNATSGSAVIFSQWDDGQGFGAQNHIVYTGPINVPYVAYTRTGTGLLNVSLTFINAFSFATIYSCTQTTMITTTPTVINPFTACSPNETTSTPIRDVRLTFSTSSSDIIIDSVGFTDTAYDSPAHAFRGKVISAAKAYGGGVRILDFNQLNNNSTNMLQTDIRGVTPFTTSLGCNNQAFPQQLYQCANATSITLPMGIDLRNQIGAVNPGVDLEFPLPPNTNTINTADAACYQSYLGDTSGTNPCYLLRQTQGLPAPLTQMATEGAKLHFPVGNENWNGNTGAKWAYVQAAGANAQLPYFYMSQNIFAAMKAGASYSSAVEDFVVGLQNSGGNTLFFADAGLAAGTGVCTDCQTIEIAPYWQGFGVTAGGFNTATPISQQMQSSLAETPFDFDSTGGSPYIIAHATSAFPSTCSPHCYATKMLNYEYNGGLTFEVSSGVPTQPELNGWQNGRLAGLVNARLALESCYSLGDCRGFFFNFINFNQAFSNGVTTTLTGTTTSGSNVITGVSSTANAALGQTISSASINGAIIGPLPFIPGTTTSLVIGGSNPYATASGSVTVTLNNISNNLWGGWLGAGAQQNNNMRPGAVALSGLNTAIPVNSNMIPVSYTSPTWSFPLTGTCPNSCNGIPASTTEPKVAAYGFKNGPKRTYIFLCMDPTGATCSVTYSGIALTGTVNKIVYGLSGNQTDNNENPTPLVGLSPSTVSMPTSDTLPAFSMTIYYGAVSNPPAATPTFSPVAGTYGSPQTVTISTTTPGASLFYSFTNILPFTAYTAPVPVNSTSTLYAYATATGYTQSATGNAAYIITPPQVPAPVFTPTPPVSQSTPITVTISDSLSGVSIFYTTNGTTPTTGSTPYTGPLTIGGPGTTNLQAIASKTGYTNSPVTSGNYTVTGSVTFICNTCTVNTGKIP